MRRYFAAALALWGVVTASFAAGAPEGGICGCGPYTEAPALCRPLAGAEQETCIQANTRWLGQCTAWREQMCHMPVATAPRQSLIPVDPALAKYIGAWSGRTVCPKLGNWRMSLDVNQQSDGSFMTKSSVQGAGEVTELVLKEDSVRFLYNSWFKETVYSGRLVSSDRIEGTVKVNNDDCQWSLARQH